jgi:hypothetical protein
MKGNHLLIGKAFTYPQRDALKGPEDSQYDTTLGLWLWGPGNDVLVKSANRDKPRPGTKKEDIETGEDLKGE